MVEYIIIILFILSFAIFSSVVERGKRVFLVISCFLLMLFSGLRTLGVSADDLNYYYSLYYKSYSFEYFYGLLEKFNTYVFNGNIHVQFFIVSFLSVSFLYLAISKYKKMCVFSILIYACHVFLYRDMIQIRAAISYNIVLLMMVCIEKNSSKIKIAFLYILSVGFHLSSLFSIASIFIKNINLNIRKFTLLVIVCFLLSLFSKEILYLLLSGFNNPKINMYLDAYLFDDGGYVYSLGYLNPSLIKSLFLSYLFIYNKEKLENSFSTRLFLNSYALSFLISLLFVDFSVFALRMASLFSCVEIILVPAIVLSSNHKYKYASLFLLIYALVFFLDIFYKGMLDGYTTILF